MRTLRTCNDCYAVHSGFPCISKPTVDSLVSSLIAKPCLLAWPGSVGLISVSKLLRLVSLDVETSESSSKDLLWLAARMYACHCVLSAGVSLYQVRLVWQGGGVGCAVIASVRPLGLLVLWTRCLPRDSADTV